MPAQIEFEMAEQRQRLEAWLADTYRDAKFKLPETVSLVEQLWATDDCEIAKLSCLYSLEPFPEARSLFEHFLKEYQSLFPASEADYRQAHMQRLLAFRAK